MRQNPNKRTLIDMLEHFQPDYIVLRPYEYQLQFKTDNLWLQTDYTIVADYRVPKEDVQRLLFPANNIDLEFLVLRRQ